MFKIAACLCHLYIDESGDEGDFTRNGEIVDGSSRFFSIGIIDIHALTNNSKDTNP